VTCPVAKRLLQSYQTASSAFREAANQVLTGLPLTDPAFPAARETMTASNQALVSARRQYWEHVREHGCRNGDGTASHNHEIGERLREDMLQARELFDGAVEKHDYLTRLREDITEEPDGGLAFAQAQHVRIRAYTLYMETLRRYADYALFGDLEVEPRHGGAEKSKPN
jgi:hypothetical protein